MATLSILGLYNYDNSIFDNFNIPTQCDKNTLINNLLYECAELEILYSNPSFMKDIIGYWSNKQIITWQSLADTFELEYNPIWNVDGTETTTETRNLKQESENNRKDDFTTTNINTETQRATGDSNEETTTTEDGSITQSSTTTENGSNLHKVNGFNDSGLTNAEQDTITNNSNTTGTNTTSNEITTTNTASTSNNATTTNNGTIKNNGTSDNSNTSLDTGTITIAKTRGGNIGVTMTQQLLNAELDVRPKMNIYSYIIDDFKKRFCLLIY